MRILLISPYFHPHKGGSQKYAQELHANLMDIDSSVKVDVLTYNTDNSIRIEKYNGFTIYRVPCIQILRDQFAIPNYIELIKLLNKLQKNNYDFINSHTRFFESSWWTPLIARHFKAKSVLTDHCANHPTHNWPIITVISRLVDQFMVPFFIKQYDFVTVTNKSTQNFLKKLGITKSEIIYGGVDTNYFKSKNKNKKRHIPNVKKSFGEKDIIVSFVGRMIYSKGAHLLLEAAEKIIKEHPNVYFIFAGDGPELKKLKLKENNQIIFLSSIEKDSVANLMKKSDILVHPSLHHEGFPNVLLEAGASSCAIIATPMGGTKEIINKKTGITIKPDPESIYLELKKLIRDPKKRLELQKSARAWVEKNYRWGEVVKDYQEFISKKIS